MNVPSRAVRAQAILFASLALTILVAFVAVLGKQWIAYYTRASTWGSIVDREKERHLKFVGLQKWRLHFIMGSLPVLLLFALSLSGIGLSVYLWDLELSTAIIVAGFACFGAAFYTFTTVAATTWIDCPFQTPLSIFLPKVLPYKRESPALACVWLGRKAKALLLRIQCLLTKSFKRISEKFTGRVNTRNNIDDLHMTISNPAFWRHDPLFISPVPEDIIASAGFWLLESSPDFSAASAVAAAFPESQWQSHQPSTTALIRLRDTYMDCFRGLEPKKPSRLKALQCAAAYYVLYHTQLIWSISSGLDVEAAKLSHLPLDLFFHKHSEEWNGDCVFEYLLHNKVEDRSEPITSGRFLSYIAPYWFCGDSDSAIQSRPSRLQTLYELIQVLEDAQALVPATITDCVLCVGVAMDFPLHPEDLIRTDKRCARSLIL